MNVDLKFNRDITYIFNKAVVLTCTYGRLYGSLNGFLLNKHRKASKRKPFGIAWEGTEHPYTTMKVPQYFRKYK